MCAGVKQGVKEMLTRAPDAAQRAAFAAWCAAEPGL
jgi:hypothetical protein